MKCNWFLLVTDCLQVNVTKEWSWSECSWVAFFSFLVWQQGFVLKCNEWSGRVSPGHNFIIEFLANNEAIHSTIANLPTKIKCVSAGKKITNIFLSIIFVNFTCFERSLYYFTLLPEWYNLSLKSLLGFPEFPEIWREKFLLLKLNETYVEYHQRFPLKGII